MKLSNIKFEKSYSNSIIYKMFFFKNRNMRFQGGKKELENWKGLMNPDCNSSQIINSLTIATFKTLFNNNNDELVNFNLSLRVLGNRMNPKGKRITGKGKKNKFKNQNHQSN
jgi:hypothetical protein